MVRTQVLKHLPGARKSKRGGSKGNVRGGAIARGAMEKSGCVRVFEAEEVRRDHPVRGDWKYLFSPRGVMTIEVPQNEEISGGGKNGGEKKSVFPSVGEEQIEGAYTLKSDNEEELLREMLTLT